MNDTIYRQDAMEAVWKPQVKPNELIFDALKRAIESEINNLPSANEVQGEWKYQFRDSENEEYRCSLCDYPQCYKSNYCPFCGAKMFAKDINAPSKKRSG